MVVKSRKQKRKFKAVEKTAKGVQKKYIKGSKNPKQTENEILRTRMLYRAGKLTRKAMNNISKKRVKSGQ